jgi:DNA repair protein RAD7
MSNNNNNANQGAPPPNQSIIRGPRSALTDYLAAHNISASDIARGAHARRDAIEAANRASLNTRQGGRSASTIARHAREEKRRHREEAIKKIKQSKSYNKRKRGNDSDDELALRLFNESAPLPGLMCNCEICGKRFTVTPYSRTGPDGDLVCSPCGRELAKDEDAKKKADKKRGPTSKSGASRRKIQSRILDGTTSVGAKPLVTLCIETLVKNVHLADDLGDLAPPTIDRIAKLLSKRRLLNSHTLNLFLQPHHDVINLYDAAKLNPDDFIKVFQSVPQLKRFKAQNAIQFNDKVMQYLITRKINLESIYIHGANLLSQDMWGKYLAKKGTHLKELRVYHTDRHFGDQAVNLLGIACPDLVRLKICHNQQVSDKGVECIAHLPKLEHVSLQLIKATSTTPYIKVIEKIGRHLQTFSIENVPLVDDSLLEAIHNKCTKLSKLRITDSKEMTDAGFVRLFKGWKNGALSYLDLEKCRYLGEDKPRDNEGEIGLCSEGFKALMEHSGVQLEYLNIHACRHISKETFEKVFASDKTYPRLRYIEVAFCEEVNDFIVGSIFRSCPNVKEVNVYGCMKVKDVRVPRGKILVGVPNAVGMQTEGRVD